MNILSAENIIKTYGETPVINNGSFFLQEGEKVGIIGINGTGKSTLLKILSGLIEPDYGTVTKANSIVIRYLPQNPEFSEGEKIMDSILKDNLRDGRSEWEVTSEAKNILSKLGINDYDRYTSTMSGGQKKKIALVSALISRADILVMDEPTNHLDNEMADYLEDYLKKFKGSLIMVTHDRYFLDSVTNRIVEIDKGNIYSYETNYSGFIDLKAQREDMEMANDRKRKSILRTELEWIKRGARARSTKQKARIERYEELKSRKTFSNDSTIEISSVSSRLGKTTIELADVSKAYDDKYLFNKFSYIFLKNDRVGFIGPNGCGKTTLMKIIGGKIPTTSGEVVVGQTVKVGYYTQEIEINKSGGIAYMDPEKRVIDYIRDTAEYVMTSDGSISASQMLEKFLFTPEKQYGIVGKLSGGEKRRLNLLRVLMEAPNVLILDEPTNDLDITTLTILESYLDSFQGIVITVSHDRYFLDRTVSRIFAFENGEINQYEGGYSDYALRKEMEGQGIVPAEISKDKTDKKNNGWVKTKKLKFTYQEQKDYETIENDVFKMEEKIQFLDKEMEKYPADFIKLNELIKEKEDVENQLSEKMDRWMYLEDLKEQIDNQ